MQTVAARFAEFISWIGIKTGVDDTILHIHAGLAVLVLARIVSRRSLGTFIPLSVVAAVQVVNEVLDRIHYHSWRWPDTISDVAHTMFWPTVICLAVRLRPMMGRPQRR